MILTALAEPFVLDNVMALASCNPVVRLNRIGSFPELTIATGERGSTKGDSVTIGVGAPFFVALYVPGLPFSKVPSSLSSVQGVTSFFPFL